MTTKPSQFLAQALVTALILSGTVACSTQIASNPEQKPPEQTAPSPVVTTIFTCVKQPPGWATIAQRGNAVSQSSLISWNSLEFGPEWTPEKRCHIVSQRLTDAVANNGGSLGGLDLTTGSINTYTVVCLVTQEQKSCDEKNLLFTLNKANAKNPAQVLVQLTNFATGLVSNKDFIERNRTPQYIPLETLVDRLLGKGF